MSSSAEVLQRPENGHAHVISQPTIASPSTTSEVEIADATVTVGADASVEEQEAVADETRNERAREPESDCISVHRPRPAGEDVVVQEDLRGEEELSDVMSAGATEQMQEPQSDANSARSLIVVMRLSSIARGSSSGTDASDDHIMYPSPQTNAATPSESAGASQPAMSPAAMPTPPSDIDMQEPELLAGPTSRYNTEPPRSAATIVVLPVNTMKLDAALYARDPNPKRSATRKYSEPKTPEPTQPKRQARSEPVDSFALPAVSQPRLARASKRLQDVVHDSQAKRRRLSAASSTSRQSTFNTRPDIEPQPFFKLDRGEARPTRDVNYDREYVAKISEILEAAGRAKSNDTGRSQARRILELLQKAEVAGEEEALYLTASEAESHLQPGRFCRNVIITAEQQPLPLQTIEQFLDEFYEDDAQVWIQDSSAKSGKNSPAVRQVKIRAVKERIAGRSSTKPWNLLELATHHEDGLRPAFLNNEDCRLLTKLKIPGAADEARRRTYPQGFKEVEKWALLAQAGALTEPHQDSHGYSTYITINVGLVGFGWLSSPTEAERIQWRKHPLKFVGGTWRYVILKPGQTVFFPAGTVHFVFRLPSVGNSLAFGGHILRCSNIAHWARTLLEERDAQNVTNEDLTDSATGYLERVGRFVTQASKSGQTERWGGEEEIAEFLRLKKEFLRRK
jgi:hypothetical protein